MANRSPAEQPHAVVSIRRIRRIDNELYEVSIRTSTGRVLGMVIPLSLISTAYISMAAEVTAVLAEMGRL